MKIGDIVRYRLKRNYYKIVDLRDKTVKLSRICSSCKTYIARKEYICVIPVVTINLKTSEILRLRYGKSIILSETKMKSAPINYIFNNVIMVYNSKFGKIYLNCCIIPRSPIDNVRQYKIVPNYEIR